GDYRRERYARLDRSRIEKRCAVLPTTIATARFQSRRDKCPGISSAGSLRIECCRQDDDGTIPDAPERKDDRACIGTRCPSRSPAPAPALSPPGGGNLRVSLTAGGLLYARPQDRQSPT